MRGEAGVRRTRHAQIEYLSGMEDEASAAASEPRVK